MATMLAAQPCEPGHQLCSPEGATSDKSPVDWTSSGTLLADFYEDLVYSVNHQPSKRYQPVKGLDSRASSVNLCCTTNTQCLLLQKFFVPFCWDHFTTNYFLSDESYGNVASGNYTLVSGQMNLITGNYTKLSSSSQTGNIYSNEDGPDTSTLPMPTPWTSSGVGTAIPASQVGETFNDTASSSTATHKITLPPSSIPASTSSTPDTASHMSAPTHARAAESMSGGLPGLLLAALLVSLL